MAFNKPFSSSSHAAPPEWKSKIATLNNEDVRVYEPTNTTTPVLITAPSLSVGDDLSVTVNKMKTTADEILADNIDNPITCQALLDSADTAVIAASNTDGYHKLPPSGKKIHAHFSSGNIAEIKTSGSIEAGTNFTTGTADDTASYFGRARVGGGGYPHLNSATFIHRGLESSPNDHTKDFAMSQQDQGTLILNTKKDKNLHFKTNGGEDQVNNNTGNVGDRMTIYEAGAVNTKGFVGINVFPPTERLHVDGNIKASGFIELETSQTAVSPAGISISHQTEGGTPQLAFGTSNSVGGIKKTAIIAEGLGSGGFGRSKLHFCLDNTLNTASPAASVSNARLTILPDGNVGIGTTTPEAVSKLHVVGGSRIDLNGGQFRIFARVGGAAGGAHTVDKFSVNYNGVYVSGQSISSDDRLKHNEEILINPLEVIRQLTPQKYKKNRRDERGRL